MALSPADRRLALTAWGLLWMLRLQLRLNRFKPLYARLAKSPPHARLDIDEGERIARLVAQVAGSRVSRATCLPRALATATLLRRKGVAYAVEIGIILNQSGLAGHAWVTCGGRVVGESAEFVARFQPLSDLPDAIVQWH